MKTRPAIGFVGLGLLGSAIVKRLLATGHCVVGYDIVPGKIESLRAAGMTAAASPAEVTRACDILQVCVMTTADVADVITGPRGVISAGRNPGKVLVDHSTTEIDATKMLAARLHAQTGMGFVDAPLSGGPGAAMNGTLSIMAGGETGIVESLRPLMEQLGRYTHMGEVGAGQATKLVNQTLVLPTYCLMAEALRLAQAFGVDAQKIPQALETGHAGSNLLPILFARMIAEDFTPAGYARQILKDLELLVSASKEQHLAMPMTSQALTLFRMLVGQGKSELDGSAVVTLLPRAKPH